METYNNEFLNSSLSSDLCHNVKSSSTCNTISTDAADYIGSTVSVKDPDLNEGSPVTKDHMQTADQRQQVSTTDTSYPEPRDVPTSSDLLQLHPALTEESVTPLCHDTEHNITAYLHMLPPELILHIFSFVSQVDLQMLRLVCHKFNMFVQDPSLWTKLDMREPIEYQNFSFETFRKHITKMPFLKELCLHGLYYLTVDDLTFLDSACPLIQVLDLGFSQGLTVLEFECMSQHFVNLISLNLEGCDKFNDECVSRLCQDLALPKLQKINMSHCPLVSDHSIKQLARAKVNLTHLNIDGIPWLSDHAVIDLCTIRGRQLQTLNLDGVQLTDSSCTAIAAKCTTIKELTFSFAELLTDQSLLELKELSTLRKLTIRKGMLLSSQGIVKMFQDGRLQNLTTLDLSECEVIEDSCVLAAVNCCGGRLVHLSLNWCWDVTDKGVEAIISTCRRLVTLSLLGMDKIKGHSLLNIPANQQQLQHMDLRTCNVIVDDVLYDIVQRKTDLIIVDYYGEKIQMIDGELTY